jgi:cation diffusion facilitator CzcD-associated flavoprotein CzcO
MESQRLLVAIVGTGFSGLCMAIELRQAGIEDFVLFERSEQLGGTWRDNVYPGCACDVPSHLYSYSFEPSTDWSRTFAPQHEIRAYLESCADKYDLRRKIRFGREIVEATFDEANAVWTIRARSGETYSANVLVFGIGAFSNPSYPKLPGLERFSGTKFHSARWEHGYDLGAKSVAVIGTGASAIQFVPQIQPRVKRLYLFQRTPPWVLPKRDRAFSGVERFVLARVPGVRFLYRQWIYWTLEAQVLAFVRDKRLMRLVELSCKRHIRRSIGNHALRAQVMPRYMPGCKRILLSNDYYPALDQPNVELLTDGISHVTERGIMTQSGREVSLDAMIFGTGFAVHEYVGSMKITGRGGVVLDELWKQGAEAYLGTATSGFPNMFMLMGPNTGLGHNSMLLMIEAQVRYAMQCIRLVQRRSARSLEVRPDVQRAYNDRLQRASAASVWTSGCMSWYLDARGKNTTLWPGSTLEFRSRTRRLNPEDYEKSPDR